MRYSANVKKHGNHYHLYLFMNGINVGKLCVLQDEYEALIKDLNLTILVNNDY